MEFRLVYRGPLPSNGSPQDKAQIRRVFHEQLRELWRREPLRGEVENFHLHTDPKYIDQEYATFEEKGSFLFLPLATPKLSLLAQLKILFLRPDEPGVLITHTGDLDNRLKTLLDSLAIPSDVPASVPATDEHPYYVLLKDDALITGVSVEADRLLDATRKDEVLLVVQVRLTAGTRTWRNIGLT